ncbi:hypothetical protein GGC47_005550 [Bosea sp. OAE752]|uniref:hypothetical protein n=1 Tax=Bosea sp. OAE752 TaxID=2663873 RepID=UPI00114DF873
MTDQAFAQPTRQMVLVKTQHTEVSFDPGRSLDPQEPRRPRFSFYLQFSNSGSFYKTDRTSSGEPASAPASLGSAEEAPLSGGAVSMGGL